MILVAIALILSSLACNIPGLGSDGGQPEDLDNTDLDALMEEVGISLDEVMAEPEMDERLETLEIMGSPDSFSLQWQTLDNQIVRWEEWSYYDFESRFDFVDGVLLWTLEIEPAPSGTFYAQYYNPLDFQYGMTMAEVENMLPEITLAEISLAEADIPGGVLMAGDQILLGFDNDELVYVQTFILEPEEPLDE